MHVAFTRSPLKLAGRVSSAAVAASTGGGGAAAMPAWGTSAASSAGAGAARACCQVRHCANSGCSGGHSHSHSSDHAAKEQSGAGCCSAGASSGHTHGHAHGHAHSHAHGGHGGHHHHHHHGTGGACFGHHHHHYHSRTGDEDSPVLNALDKLGLFKLSDHLEHHTAYTVASIAAFAASLALPFAAAAGLLPAAAAQGLAAACIATTFVLSGVPQLVETALAFAHGRLDVHVLMSLSVLGTLYLGMAQEGALLLLLFRVSHLLEDRLTAAAAGGLERLFDSVPTTATTVDVDPSTGAPRGASAAVARASDVAPGQHVLVRPGEPVPLDGVVVWGAAGVSLQHITGESAPLRVQPGASVPAGSVSNDGSLVLRVTARAEDSTPARMARMAADAQAARPRLQRWLDGVGEVWSKAVVGATLATAVLLPLLGVPLLGDRGALYRAMGVLTAGSPCALALVPLAYVCAIAAITSRGVLVKSGAALDALHGCGVVALDKTGTITMGRLSLAEAYTLQLPGSTSGGGSAQSAAFADLRASLAAAADDGGGGGGGDAGGGGGPALALEADALKVAVALSRLSNHPVSRALVAAAPRADWDVSVEAFEQVPGAGVQGVCTLPGQGAVLVRFGSPDWLSSFLPDAAAAAALRAHASGQHDRPTRAVALTWILPLPEGFDAASGSTSASSASLAGLERSDSGGSSVSGSSAGSGTSSSAVIEAAIGAAARLELEVKAGRAQPGQQQQLAMLCFEDEIQPGVAEAVEQLKSGGWARRMLPVSAAARAALSKDVVMLTGDNQHVAAAVAAAVGIKTFQAGLRPEDKLAYVQQASGAAAPSPGADGAVASAAAGNGGGGSGGGARAGLVMVGDGINDAPALAAAQLGIAIASSPGDMVSAAADVIVLNGRGVTNLPWLFGVADRTQTVVRQNLVLALVSVTLATLPTLAGYFPLWLAVSLHEGATLMVALNSLRLLWEAPGGGGGGGQPGSGATGAHLHHHHHHHHAAGARHASHRHHHHHHHHEQHDEHDHALVRQVEGGSEHHHAPGHVHSHAHGDSEAEHDQHGCSHEHEHSAACSGRGSKAGGPHGAPVAVEAVGAKYKEA